MAKYLVQVGFQVFHVAHVEVEAANEQEAATKAIEKAGDDTLDFMPDPYDEGGTLQVLECQEQWEEDNDPAALRMYDVLVRYRTNSGCNAKAVQIAAMSPADAMQIAGTKVARMRGVVGIDECNITTSWEVR